MAHPARSAKKHGRIVCFGEALIDFLALPPEAGAPPRFVQQAGGAPANVAVAAARLGARTAFVGMLATDPFGDFLFEQLTSAGVDTHGVSRTSAANTALAFVTLGADGERRFSFYRPPAADLLFRPAHFRTSTFADVAVFHVCSNSLTESTIASTTLDGMHRARAAGAIVSMDLNWRPGLWAPDVDPRSRVWRALHAADFVKLSRSELDWLAQPLGGDAAAFQELWGGHAQLVVVTDGAATIRWYTRAKGGNAATFRVDAVDTTAAGDAFVGALLATFVEHDVRRAELATLAEDRGRFDPMLRFAAASGALSTTRHGAFAALPTRTEIRKLLAAAP